MNPKLGIIIQMMTTIQHPHVQSEIQLEKQLEPDEGCLCIKPWVTRTPDCATINNLADSY